MKKITIAFQGERGAFSEEATLRFGKKHFSQSIIEPVPMRTFRKVFDAVSHNQTEFGMIPIENSLFGSVYENYDLLQHYRLSIIGEVKLRVRHMLMTLPPTKIGNIKQVLSRRRSDNAQTFFRQ